MKALLSSLSTVETMAPAAGTASTDASMHADSAAGASTPSLLNRELSFDITVIRLRESLRKLPRDRHRGAIRFARCLALECGAGAAEPAAAHRHTPRTRSEATYKTLGLCDSNLLRAVVHACCTQNKHDGALGWDYNE